LECQGQIIQVYDPVYHQPIQDAEQSSVLAFEPQYDQRWIKCRRPFIVTGGELTLEMLDLSYNSTSKVYDAPYQLKANNGIYLIDDFGRQQCTPADVLNRWIVPMERRVDYLKFHSGSKMTVPFEAFLIFSTNLKPEQLGDEAFLRRIQYKMLLRSPDEEEFAAIFRRFCESRDLDSDNELIARFIAKHYNGPGKPFRRCHPRDVLSHAIDLINFEKLPFQLTDDVLDRAFESCFLEETEY
jgi:predicted ATPase with chaperone activity